MGYVISIVMGLLVGGLVNLLADDLPARRRPGWPRCPVCQQGFSPLGWWGAIRWLQGGRCPLCNERERWRPLLVELLTALLFAWAWNRLTEFAMPLYVTWFYLAAFVLIFVTDMEHRLILHAVTFPAVGLALLVSFYTVTLWSALLGAAFGFVFFLLVYWLGGVVFGSGAMGFGDVTLATFVGAAVGFPQIVVALLLAVLVGGVVSFGLVLTRVRRLRSKIPYGPFLLIGATVTLLYGLEIIEWYLI